MSNTDVINSICLLFLVWKYSYFNVYETFDFDNLLKLIITKNSRDFNTF